MKERDKQIAIIGAGGHCRSLIPVIERNQYRIEGIYDENYREDELISGYILKGDLSALPEDTQIVLAVGSNLVREKIFLDLNAKILKANLAHPLAHIENRFRSGVSNQIFAYAVINSEARIGRNNIINTQAVIEHESVIGDHCHISVGTLICGRARVGDRCFIGAGSVVNDRVSIVSDVTVGSGSVVNRDITEPGTYVGCPVRKIK